jgi:hypothetical protein
VQAGRNLSTVQQDRDRERAGSRCPSLAIGREGRGQRQLVAVVGAAVPQPEPAAVEGAEPKVPERLLQPSLVRQQVGRMGAVRDAAPGPCDEREPR